MRAVCWYASKDIRVMDVPDPRILNPRDAIVRVEAAAICGSDLHLYQGLIPGMEKGDILGHEFLGEVVEVGSANKALVKGDRVVVPFTVSCGNCLSCSEGLWSLCDNSNPNAALAEKVNGYSGAGLFGYSHVFGGYAGGQAEYVRVPFADVGPMKIPPELTDEQALTLADIFPTAYMAAENCSIRRGDIVAIWGCGPVGLLCILSAYLQGAERVIAIDRIPERLSMARHYGKAETIDFEERDVLEELREMTGGRGPDACIDAVGFEAHGNTASALTDRVMNALRLKTDRSYVLGQALKACRKGGVVSIPGVYVGYLDKLPLGTAFAKGLRLAMGQTHVHRYLRPLRDRILCGEADPSFVVTHKHSLEEAPEAYETFLNRKEGCVKVMLRPELSTS